MDNPAGPRSRFSSKERIFLFLAALCGFLISADYAIVRPASQSLFIDFFGSAGLPYVWLCSIPLNLAVVAFHNRFLPGWGCSSFFLLSAVTIGVVNCVAARFIGTVPSVSFLFYMWKEVYILLMFQQLWAVIHSTVRTKDAVSLYGILFGFGALGGVFGSMVPGLGAVRAGTESLLFCSLPIYLLTFSVFWFLLRFSGGVERVSAEKTKSFASMGRGTKLILGSPLLKGIVWMSVFMQISATLADFRFQSFLEQLFPDRDLRTASAAQILSAGNVVTMALQFFGTFACIRLLGLQRAHLLVPAVLSVVWVAFLVAPSFSTVSLFFVLIKAFEFSLFTLIKEMLYIPTKPEEKFQAKAIIDVFVSRFAKIGASVVIVGCRILFPSSVTVWISWIALLILIAWIFLVISLKSRYQESEIPTGD